MPFALILLLADFSQTFQLIRDRATPAQLYAFLYALPKGGDLHHHAGLSFPAPVVLDAALRQRSNGYTYYTRTAFHPCPDNANEALLYANISRHTYSQLSPCRQSDYTPLESLTPAQRESWHSALVLDQPGESRNEFFEEIVPRLTPLLRNPYLFADGFAENLKLFGAEGVRYIEAQWNPLQAQKPDGSLFTVEETLKIFRDRMAQPDVQAANVAYRFQTTVIRFRDDLESQIATQHRFIDAHRDLWVGINAAGREDNDKGHALRMLNGFRLARRQHSGIRMSIHAGEKDSPGPEVRNTLTLGAERIGHGVNLISDPDTMLLLRNGRTLVEINLVSNRLLDYTPDLSQHPFPEYLRFGIPVCLNTDDRGSWDSNMTDEYMHAVSLFKLTWDEVKQLGRDSLAYSFAPPELKASLLRSYSQAIARFEARFTPANWQSEISKITPQTSPYARRLRLIQ
jgi:adenosine deaminase CECR1